MLNFRAGAPRQAVDGACPKRHEAANDLVRRTLARHGLWSGTDGPVTPDEMPAAAPLQDLMKAFDRSKAWPDMPRPESRPVAMPEGAAFRSDTYTGHTGSRAYRHYVPASAGDGVNGIVLMLHGCTQTPEDFATGTKMNTLAEQHRLAVIYPEQARGANAQSCWNWFSKGDQQRNRGEPEILAGIARTAMAEHGVPAERVFVAGLSAGAAMAVILGEAYPDIFAAIGAHSGLPFGAARDVPSAFAAMAGDLQRAVAVPPATSTQRAIVFHGTADRTVHPSNGAEIARRASSSLGAQTVQTTESAKQGGRSFERIVTSGIEGTVLTEHWVIDGLGHAWSGGNGAGSYADPSGPDASAEMVRFFLDLPAEGARRGK